MQGRLRVVFRARNDETYLAQSFVQSPLKILRHFRLADGRAVLQILQTTPGVFAGDDYQIEIVVESGAAAVVMSPSASKLHRMEEGACAMQRLDISVHDDAHLEYYPALHIPFPKADFRQHLEISLSPKARLALVERWAMGRVERGEHLQFRRLSSRTAVDLAGRAIYRDAVELTPGADCSMDWGVLEGRRYTASGFWFGGGGEAPAVSSVSLDSLHAFGQIELGQHYFRGLFGDGLEMSRAVGQAIQRMCRSWALPEPPLGSFSC